MLWCVASRTYESELRDDSEFFEWQAKMRERDERKRLEEVERRRVQMLLTDENAKEARVQNRMDNQRLASEMRSDRPASVNALHPACVGICSHGDAGWQSPSRALAPPSLCCAAMRG